MVTVTVLKPFYDLVERCNREEGDEFEATEERAEHIDAALPTYITYAATDGEGADIDLKKMTNPQLAALAKERGIEVKGHPTKAKLIELLSEE